MSWIETIIRCGLKEKNPELLCPVEGCLRMPHAKSKYCRRHLRDHTPRESDIAFFKAYLEATSPLIIGIKPTEDKPT